MGALTVAPVLLVFAVATFPGELLDGNPVTLRFIPTRSPDWSVVAPKTEQPAAAKSSTLAKPSSSTRGDSAEAGDQSVATNPGFFARAGALLESMGWISPHDWLVAGEVDLRARKPRSLFSNRLVLPALDAIDHTKFDSEAKFAAVTETVSPRMRDLRGAVLIDASLRKADFTAANLQDAYLDRADLREAKFECAPSKLDVFPTPTLPP